jgi:hypothetical protein
MQHHRASTKLVRLISARADMGFSLEAHSHFAAALGSPLAEHCFLAMVVAYCRPFFESYRVGRILCDFPAYPDFDDAEMNIRHQRMVDIRNKFLAHSSAEGTRVIVVPPGAANPISGLSRPFFEHLVGKRTFLDPRFADWLVEVAYAFKGRLDVAVRDQLQSEFGARHPIETFELDTGWADFSWSQTGEQGAPPNGDPAPPLGNSGVTERPPSVS